MFFISKFLEKECETKFIAKTKEVVKAKTIENKEAKITVSERK
jgi:hypothetical protein